MAASALWTWMWTLAKCGCVAATTVVSIYTQYARMAVADHDTHSVYTLTHTPAAQVRNPKGDEHEPPKSYTFDQVYDINSGQTEIFDITAKPIINSVMEGYNGTIFAYGQVGQ